MARDRIESLATTRAMRSRNWDAVDPPSLQFRHDMMRAKLSGFIEAPQTVARRYPSSDMSMPAAYARAIVAYRTGGARNAVRAIDALIAAAPDNPYFHELKGQALLEAGKAARSGRPAAPRRRAGAPRRADPHPARPRAPGDRRRPATSTRRWRASAPASPMSRSPESATAISRPPSSSQGRIADAEVATRGRRT